MKFIESQNVFIDDSQKDVGYVSIYAPPNAIIEYVYQNKSIYGFTTKEYYELYTLPLSYLDGEYIFRVYSKDYSIIAEYPITVEGLTNDVFLLSNSLVDFKESQLIVNLANGLYTDNIEEYILKASTLARKNIKQDDKMPSTVFTNLYEVWYNKKGVCFNKASFVCAMLRYNHIPCKLIFGYNERNNYHAWCACLLNNQWVEFDPNLVDIYNISGYKQDIQF
jgi:transglutaminase-like putative cysteine protease